MIEEHKDEPEPLRLDKTDVKKLLERSGAREENLEQFDREFDAAAGDTPSLLASNVANTPNLRGQDSRCGHQGKSGPD